MVQASSQQLFDLLGWFLHISSWLASFLGTVELKSPWWSGPYCSKILTFPYCFGRFGFLLGFCFPKTWVKGVCMSWFRHNYVGWASQWYNFIWKGDGRQLLNHYFPSSPASKICFSMLICLISIQFQVCWGFPGKWCCQRLGGIWAHAESKVLLVLYSWCTSFACWCVLFSTLN